MIGQLKTMKHRFLIHELNHTTLLVDISDIGLPAEILPAGGKSQPVSSLRFQSWQAAEEYLRSQGACQESLIRVKDELKKVGVAALTI